MVAPFPARNVFESSDDMFQPFIGWDLNMFVETRSVQPYAYPFSLSVMGDMQGGSRYVAWAGAASRGFTNLQLSFYRNINQLVFAMPVQMTDTGQLPVTSSQAVIRGVDASSGNPQPTNYPVITFFWSVAWDNIGARADVYSMPIGFNFDKVTLTGLQRADATTTVYFGLCAFSI